MRDDVLIDRLRLGVPEELRQLDAWLCWRKVVRAGSEKFDKIPHYPNGVQRHGEQGSDDDRKALGTFDAAVAQIEAGHFDGVGVAMLGQGYTGLDFDGCVNDSGVVDPAVLEMVEGTYCEKSPSGRGIRAFYRGELPDALADRKDPRAETFCKNGFLTITGNRINGVDIAPLPDQVVQRLAAIFGASRQGQDRRERLSDAKANDAALARLYERQMVIRDCDGGKFEIVCPFGSEHTTAGGAGATVYFLPHTNGFQRGHFHCLHAHCADRTDAEFLAAIGLAHEQAQPKAEAKTDKPPGAGTSDVWPPALDLEVLAEREPQAPRFIMADWLPEGYATLFAGHGGVGKSAIGLHLAVCMTAGLPFFGLPVERRRVLYMSCEDREKVLHWRLARICKHLGLEMAGLRGWLEIIDLVGSDTILWSRDPRTGYSLTAAYGRLDARIKQHDSEVLFVDGINDTYAGGEGNKAEVKAFVNALLRLISPERGAVLLIGHVSKPTAMGIGGPTTEGYSGTTGWHNAARARWYLYPETEQGEDGGRPDRTGGLLMELQKSNLGRIDQSLRFCWDDDAHMFLNSGVAAESLFDRNHRERTERRGILQAFQACTAQIPHIVVPTATQGKRTTYGVLVLRAEFPASLKQGKPSRARFWRGLEALKQDGLVVESEYMRPDRHRAIQIVLTEKGQRECGVFD